MRCFNHKKCEHFNTFYKIVFGTSVAGISEKDGEKDE